MSCDVGKAREGLENELMQVKRGKEYRMKNCERKLVCGGGFVQRQLAKASENNGDNNVEDYVMYL